MVQKVSSSKQLGIRISRFVDETGKVRFTIQDRESLTPYISASIYEAALSKQHHSHNSIFDAIQKLSYVFEWAKLHKVNLDEVFLTGATLSEQQINSFSNWLDERTVKETDNRILDKTINSIIDRTSQATRWFIDQYLVIPAAPFEREILISQYKEQVAERFSKKIRKVINKKAAGDLTDEEISMIDQLLEPETRIKNNKKIHRAQAIRDYLIFRLIYEFGLRQSEVLALRLDDCPHHHQKVVKIVRIEERGKDYSDPRGAYSPRPKTLSRDLGFLHDNSRIIELINDYITKYRFRNISEHGQTKKRVILDRPAFLILSHKHNAGKPLSISSMQNIANKIRDETGIVNFHWHLLRHAFFNRRYSEAMKMKKADVEKYKNSIRDIVYWGGWEDENSLQMYIQKARRDQAINAMKSLYE